MAGKDKARMVIEEMVSVEDILPTCLLAAGMKLPEKLSGRALQPLLKERKLLERFTSIYNYWCGTIDCLSSVCSPNRSLQIDYYSKRAGKNLSALAYLNDLNSFYVAGTKQKK